MSEAPLASGLASGLPGEASSLRLSGLLPSASHERAGHLQAGFGGTPAPRAGSIEAAAASEVGPLLGGWRARAPRGGFPLHGRGHVVAA